MYLINAFINQDYKKIAVGGCIVVKVITIMDDVYANLYRLKVSKDMSFSEVIRYLMNEVEKENKSIISFAGSLNAEDVDFRAIREIKRGFSITKYL